MGDQMCFGCSPENPRGLQLTFRYEGETTYTEFFPDSTHQSYDGVFHGGLIITIMDELIGKHLMQRNHKTVTGRMNVRFKRTVPLQEIVVFGCRIEKQRGSLFIVQAWAEIKNGERAVTAEAHMMEIA